jgi:hypothetical protein
MAPVAWGCEVHKQRAWRSQAQRVAGQQLAQCSLGLSPGWLLGLVPIPC